MFQELVFQNNQLFTITVTHFVGFFSVSITFYHLNCGYDHFPFDGILFTSTELLNANVD